MEQRARVRWLVKPRRRDEKEKGEMEKKSFAPDSETAGNILICSPSLSIQLLTKTLITKSTWTFRFAGVLLFWGPKQRH